MEKQLHQLNKNVTREPESLIEILVIKLKKELILWI